MFNSFFFLLASLLQTIKKSHVMPSEISLGFLPENGLDHHSEPPKALGHVYSQPGWLPGCSKNGLCSSFQGGIPDFHLGPHQNCFYSPNSCQCFDHGHLNNPGAIRALLSLPSFSESSSESIQTLNTAASAFSSLACPDRRSQLLPSSKAHLRISRHCYSNTPPLSANLCLDLILLL